MTKPPELGLSARASLLRVVDGDTIDVELRLPCRIRLLDCWAPESNTEEGRKATQRITMIMGDGKELVVFIPTTDAHSLKDVMTFGRVLGHVWNREAEDSVSELMVSSGLATVSKEG